MSRKLLFHKEGKNYEVKTSSPKPRAFKIAAPACKQETDPDRVRVKSEAAFAVPEGRLDTASGGSVKGRQAGVWILRMRAVKN